MPDYSRLVTGPLRFAGVDQGIDFVGPGKVLALDTAQVTRIERSGTGWPGQGAVLVYKLLSGPAKGHSVYVAEDFAPAPNLRVGSVVPKGTVVGDATGSGQAPGIEIGWATDQGLPLAPRPAPRPAPQWTKEGANFFSFVTGSGLVPTGGVGSDTPNANTEAGKTAAGAAKHIPGVQQVLDTGTFLGRLTDPSYLLRGLQVIAGGALVLTGTLLLARQVALAADLPDPAGLATRTGTASAAPVE